GTQTLAQQQITVSVDRLTEIFGTGEIAGFAPVVRYARARQDSSGRWMTYGAIYQRTEGKESEIQVVVDDARAWKSYEQDSTLGVIENSNVRVRERTGSVTASWRSNARVVTMTTRTLRDLDRAFVRNFLAKYPSDLRH